MKIIIGADHAGLKLKEKLKKHLDKKGVAYEDVGTHSSKSVDYPDFAAKVANKVKKTKDSKGILVCGTGTGMVIAANKVKGIRAVAAYDPYTAKMSRADNDSNVLGLRGRAFAFENVKKIVDVWLKTPFSGNARHKRRIEKIRKIER
ncbi:TPA: ribose 5-phosphate isomerase B [Candidatus Woesearchaeota archaeon]|nr:ribose 5-phosphate isomerase B [Candidatus Woesearchaeota archaeon]